MSDAIACRLCGGSAAPFTQQRVLDKYDVRYFRCATCDLLQTEAPYWLEEAYSHALAALDTGALVRNQVCARLTLTTALLGAVGDRACLDFGGGHGVLVRMLRDFGLDFRWYDRFGENLFARGFTGNPDEPHALVTAFEVLEHFADVGVELDRLFRPGHGLVLAGTVLHDGPADDWFYYTPESGQHVAFYSRRTMQHIAARYGYDVHAGEIYTLFVRRDLPLRAWRRALLGGVVRAPWWAYGVTSLVPDPVLLKLGPFRSRTQRDHDDARAKKRD
jgi:hypothetical protein